MAPVLRVGCAMWANRDWVGPYLPADTRPGQELAAYARLCTAVEGNTTFYALPPESTVRRWAEEAPPGFRFVCKLPREVTHERRLRHAGDEARAAVDRLRLLGDRLGGITAQLPPSFGPHDLPVLDAFLAQAPGEVRWSVEVRHRSFEARGSHEARLDDLLRQRGVDRVVIDTRALFAGPCETDAEREAFERKPRLAVRPVSTADQPVVRFIGQAELAANPAFWHDWLRPVARWLADGKEPIVFLHTPDNRHAPALARAFHRDVAAEVDGLTPLPEPLPVTAQRSLF